MIQGCLIQVLLKKRCFLKKVENQPVEISIQTVVLHLQVFEKNLKNMKLVSFVVKSIQPIVSYFQLIDFLKSLTELY